MDMFFAYYFVSVPRCPCQLSDMWVIQLSASLFLPDKPVPKIMPVYRLYPQRLPSFAQTTARFHLEIPTTFVCDLWATTREHTHVLLHIKSQSQTKDKHYLSKEEQLHCWSSGSCIIQKLYLNIKGFRSRIIRKKHSITFVSYPFACF